MSSQPLLLPRGWDSALATLNDRWPVTIDLLHHNLHVQSYVRYRHKRDKCQELLASKPTWTKADIKVCNIHQCKWLCNLHALAITNMDLSTTWRESCARCPCSKVNFTAKPAMCADGNYENCIFANLRMESGNMEISTMNDFFIVSLNLE